MVITFRVVVSLYVNFFFEFYELFDYRLNFERYVKYLVWYFILVGSGDRSYALCLVYALLEEIIKVWHFYCCLVISKPCHWNQGFPLTGRFCSLLIGSCLIFRCWWESRMVFFKDTTQKTPFVKDSDLKNTCLFPSDVA